MSSKTKRRLNKFADVLEAVANIIINAIELVIIDAVFGKSKYRKRGPKMRPIVHRTYHRNRTVYIQRVMLPTEQERVHIVKTNR
jgi:hypothetical protein